MDREVRDAWVKALRSGKRKQCTGHLRHDEGHCCLGVLARDVLNLRLDRYPSSKQNNRVYGAVTKALGSFDRTETFFSLNDAKHMTFDKIADHIERNYR